MEYNAKNKAALTTIFKTNPDEFATFYWILTKNGMLSEDMYIQDRDDFNSRMKKYPPLEIISRIVMDEFSPSGTIFLIDTTDDNAVSYKDNADFAQRMAEWVVREVLDPEYLEELDLTHEELAEMCYAENLNAIALKLDPDSGISEDLSWVDEE